MPELFSLDLACDLKARARQTKSLPDVHDPSHVDTRFNAQAVILCLYGGSLIAIGLLCLCYGCGMSILRMLCNDAIAYVVKSSA